MFFFFRFLPILASALLAPVFGAVGAHAQNLFLDGPPARRLSPQQAEEAPVASGTDFADELGRAQSPLIGKIIWTDKTGRHAVAWLNSPAPLPLEAPVSANTTNPTATTAANPATSAQKTPPPVSPAAGTSGQSNSTKVNSAPANSVSSSSTATVVSPQPPPSVSVPTRTLIAVGPKLEPLALLRVAHRNPGERATGLIVERGTVRPGQEIVLPSPELSAAFSLSPSQ